MAQQIVAGIDIGSTATKCVLLDASRLGGVGPNASGPNASGQEILAAATLPTGWTPREAGEAVLRECLAQTRHSETALARVVVTGYGRNSLPGLGKALTEISCHARGANFLLAAPEHAGPRLVLDIGGQDSKVIQFGPEGQVLDFVMNDKCAAGTGRFLSNMAAALGLTLEELAAQALAGTPIQLSSMCAVFAESEIIGSIARGAAPGDLAAGIFQSIARRLKALLGRFPAGQPCVFTGGLARNADIAALLSRHLEQDLTPVPWPQHAGAVGAALFAAS